MLALMVAVIVLLGMLATPFLITAIAPGYSGPKADLTIQLVRILFPGAGLLVLSAWCLGILNSHYKFLLSYAAPVLWNAAMIATLILYGSAELPRLATILAWGSCNRERLAVRGAGSHGPASRSGPEACPGPGFRSRPHDSA
jgi:putative peptidoglycan lipid II flippase